VQQAAELLVAAPTIAASLDGRYMSALKDQRVAAADHYSKLGLEVRLWGGLGLLLSNLVDVQIPQIRASQGLSVAVCRYSETNRPEPFPILESNLKNICLLVFIRS
jgi:6-phosphogluconate dehydrogenase